jgi:hypothetical protein
VAWQTAIPADSASDLVVVGSAASHEFVECAISSVSADTVTVVLDEETIPVKRAKVIGLHWLRGEQAAAAGAAGSSIVSVAGGELRASRVEWSADGLVVDGELRLPAAMFVGVDYAAGRIVSLASLTAERVDVEPWFGGLVARGSGKSDPLSAFFMPRPLERQPGTALPPPPGQERTVAGMSAPGIIMRPRTVAVWRLPPDARRFRSVVAAAAGPQVVDASVVIVAVDDRELFRRQIDGSTGSVGTKGEGAAGQDGGGIPIDIDLVSGRRLTVTVDFVPGGGIGGAVRFGSPVIER